MASPETGPAASSRPFAGLLFWLPLAALFILVAGARLWITDTFASPIPFMDQWGLEANELYKPLVEGTFAWGHLFKPAREHRILFYALLSIGLLKLNGQWDVLLQLSVNAVLHATIATLLAAILLRVLQPKHTSFILVTVALLFGLPVAWESAVLVMSVQYLLAIVFSLVTIWGVGLHRALSVRWCRGGW